MLKIQILTACGHCNGQACIPNGEGEDHQGHKFARYSPCPMCEGTGKQPKWVSLSVLKEMLVQVQCPHAQTSYQGGMHFSVGDVWDDIIEVCNDCGAHLD